MIEYLHTAIRATKAEDVAIEAVITNEDGVLLTGKFHLGLYDNDNKIGEYAGVQQDGGAYRFTIPMAVTSGLNGRYFYCICDNVHKNYCFKQPIYFI